MPAVSVTLVLVAIRIFDINGKIMQELFEGELSQGIHQIPLQQNSGANQLLIAQVILNKNEKYYYKLIKSN